MTTEPDRVESLGPVTDHVALGVSRLARRWRRPVVDAVNGVAVTRTSRTERLLTPWLQQVQDLESAAWTILALRLADAEGVALDQLGALLGTGRGGLSDTVYRRLLRGVAVAIGASGTGDELRAVIDAVLPDDDVALDELFPATLRVAPAALIGVSAQALHAALRRAVAGGVRLLTLDVSVSSAFAFAEGDETVTDATYGLGDIAQSTGGKLVGVIDASA